MLKNLASFSDSLSTADHDFYSLALAADYLENLKFPYGFKDGGRQRSYVC